jgi:hypothetical protein
VVPAVQEIVLSDGVGVETPVEAVGGETFGRSELLTTRSITT